MRGGGTSVGVAEEIDHSEHSGCNAYAVDDSGALCDQRDFIEIKGEHIVG